MITVEKTYMIHFINNHNSTNCGSKFGISNSKTSYLK